MNTYSERARQNNSSSSVESSSQKQTGEVSAAFEDKRSEAIAQRRLQDLASRAHAERQPGAIQRKTSDDGEGTDVAQRALVAQLATRLSSPFQFQGGLEALRNLIYRWIPRGIQVQVNQTDFVGGTYTVRFTRNEGAISLQQANAWVQNALSHASQDESSSDDSSSDEYSSDD